MHIENFINFLKHEKRYSPNTVLSYRNDLDQFTTYLRAVYEIDSLHSISAIHIRSWIVSMMEEGMTARSVSRKISSLKSYYKFLVKRGLAERNPTLKIVVPKVSKKLPEYVEQPNMDKLLNLVDWGVDFAGRRDRLVVEMLYCTGMRLSELINLKETDVDFSKSTIKVMGKGSKERIIPFGNDLAQFINQYLEEKEKTFGTDFLLITDKGKKMYPKFVYRLVNKFLSMVTTIDKKSPHVLRHTFATHMANNGADLNAIKELLGHASLAATQVYTHNNIDKLKEIYKIAHPKA